MMNNEAMLQIDNETYEQIKLILDYYGWDCQRKKACETLAELLTEILHHDPLDVLNSKDIYRYITSKVADVCIMLEQIAKMYSIKKSDIHEEMTDTLKRAQTKIREEVGKRRIKGIGLEGHVGLDILNEPVTDAEIERFIRRRHLWKS